jgi:hypothetical protein
MAQPMEQGAAMRAGVSAAIVSASILAGGTAWSACLPSQSHHCVDLEIVPQISQEIVAGERIAVPPKTARAVEPQPAYTGPTVGLSPTVRQTPTVGYRWSID